jgi:hypothetical protein
MRFKFVLPVLQTAAMLLIVWAPWAPESHMLNGRLANGTESKTWVLIPGPDAVEWAEGANLPAAAVAVPLEFSIRRNDALPNYKVKFWGFWIVGLLCWYMVGRFADDLVRWRLDRALPPKRGADMAFALIAAPSAILLAIAYFSAAAEARALVAWGAVWVVITSAILLFRLAQFFRESFKPPVS